MSGLITPEDVRTKIFATHRFREGYDLDEVDAFLETVADSIRRLAATCRSLSGQLEDKDMKLAAARADAIRYRNLYRTQATRRRTRGRTGR